MFERSAQHLHETGCTCIRPGSCTDSEAGRTFPCAVHSSLSCGIVRHDPAAGRVRASSKKRDGVAVACLMCAFKSVMHMLSTSVCCTKDAACFFVFFTLSSSHSWYAWSSGARCAESSSFSLAACGPVTVLIMPYRAVQCSSVRLTDGCGDRRQPQPLTASAVLLHQVHGHSAFCSRAQLPRKFVFGAITLKQLPPRLQSATEGQHDGLTIVQSSQLESLCTALNCEQDTVAQVAVRLKPYLPAMP